MSEPLSCEERGGFCAVGTLSERCQNTVRTLSERCQNGQVSVRTGVGAPQTRFGVPVLVLVRASPVPIVVQIFLDAQNSFSHYTPTHGQGAPTCSDVFFCVSKRTCTYKERKKENRQPKGGMGGRHAATTQGF